MGKEINIYNYENRKKKDIERLNTLSPSNKKDIEKFCTSILTQGLSQATFYKYLERLPQLAILLGKDFRDATKEDIQNLFEKMVMEKDYSKNTVGGYQILIRRFYQWLCGYKRKHYPEIVDWISANVHHKKLVRPEDILDGTDLQKLVASAMNPRDRALIMVLAESGGRVSEVLGLRVGHVTFDSYGGIFILHGKTGERICRIVNAVPYLQAWLRSHPERENPESPLWVVLGCSKFISKQDNGDKYKIKFRNNLCYAAARKMLRDCAKRAGIKKPVNPHNFRHSRATSLAVAGLNSAIMNEIMGWTQGSNMSATYLHISRQQTENALLTKVYGIKVDESTSKTEKESLPLVCVNCGTKNYPDSNYCSLCNQRIGAFSKEDIEKDRTNNQILKAVSSLVGESGDVKRALIELLKKEILEEIKSTKIN